MKFMRPSPTVLGQLRTYEVLAQVDEESVFASVRDMGHRYESCGTVPATDPRAQRPGGSGLEGEAR